MAVPSSSATSWSRGEPPERRSPHPACARVGRSCRSPVAEGSCAHGADPPGTPTLVVLPCFLLSCSGLRMPPRPKPVRIPRSLPHPPNGRTSAPRRPAHVGHAAGDASFASIRGLPASLSSERACMGACRRYGVSDGRDGPAGNEKSRRRCPPGALASGPTSGPARCAGPWWTVEHRDATPLRRRV
jgi:hypothetical protein